jgi:tetratricopeptide (TPR) repeat protein
MKGGALMVVPRRRFTPPQRKLVKQPIIMTRGGVVVPPDPDDSFERWCPNMTLHLDCLPEEYPTLAWAEAAMLYQQGRQSLAANPAEVHQALLCFRAVLHRFPYYWPAMNNLGVVTELLGAAHLRGAAELYTAAMGGSRAMLVGELARETVPTVTPVTDEHLTLSLAAASFNLGSLLRTRGNYEMTLAYHPEALERLRRSLALTDPRRTSQKHTRLVVIAACLDELGQREAALQVLQQAYELDKDHWYAKREHNCRSFPTLIALIQITDLGRRSR